jgi:glycosyltransferase involved in cell wall biosynthesis
MRSYSIVIPVYNRPEELAELLTSLTKQTYSLFEVVVVEDGSVRKSDGVVKTFVDQLNIRYFYIENRGQGFARNYGFEQANGDYFIVFDSDTVIPSQYLQEVDTFLNSSFFDAFGGPDAADKDFSDLQKAISYAMTSIFTTGGIRGKKANAGGSFQPRSFNMGISRKVFEETGGFAKRDMGEDIELGIRLNNAGYRIGLIQEAYVYHKRRGNFTDFFKQVYSFGRTRFLLDELHPGLGLIKPVHAFPALFTLFCLAIPLWFVFFPPFYLMSLAGLVLLVAVLFVDATVKNGKLSIGFLSVIASFVQLWGYGLGFLKEGLRRLF